MFQSENLAIMNFNFDLSANLSHSSSYFSSFGLSNLPSSPGDQVIIKVGLIGFATTLYIGVDARSTFFPGCSRER